MTDLEKHVQRDVTLFFEGLGCEVKRLGGANRRTTTAPGFPDLWIFCRRRRFGGWFECKAIWGRPSSEQTAFAESCIACGVPYGIGGMAEARELAKAYRMTWEPAA